MPDHHVVAVGASAGGVEALTRFVRELSPSLPATILVVLHLPPDAASNLATILDRSGPLHAVTARNGDRLRESMIFVGPPDRHLMVRDGAVMVVPGPTENLHRPSVDVLFRSLAINHDGDACGIVLSGALDDGTAGIQQISRSGGLTIVQEPTDAIVPGMPASVLRVMEPDHVLPADEIGRQLEGLLAARPAVAAAGAHRRTAIDRETRMSQLDSGRQHDVPSDQPSPFGCPDCGGVLWEMDGGASMRFRCRVGHAYTARALLAAEGDGLEQALWSALRALEEQEALARRMLDRNWATGSRSLHDRLVARADDAHRRAGVLRDFLRSPIPDLDGGPSDDNGRPQSDAAGTGEDSAAAAGTASATRASDADPNAA